jgi:uncharacterized protein (TIGR00369 family)
MFNFVNIVHGGMIAYIIDIYTTFSISGVDKNSSLTVSADLNVNYLKALDKSHSHMLVLTEVNKIGRNLCFTEAWIYDEKQNLCYMGRHTMAKLPKAKL